ncbi:unnamed protein product [Adineta steineri]|uniref:Secreted protein n=2 Tax=Adineta steineri TaxID=433720 RepID=A0A814RSA9_9BILA|nr:unnamed protein product [Adineta steineri]
MIKSMIAVICLLVAIQNILAVPFDDSIGNRIKINSSMMTDSQMKRTEIYNIHSLTTDSTNVIQKYHQKRQTWWEQKRHRPGRNCRNTGCTNGQRCTNCWGTWRCMPGQLVC